MIKIDHRYHKYFGQILIGPKLQFFLLHADNLGEPQRIAAFAVLNGVAAAVSIVAAVYMIFFFKDKPRENDKLEPLMLNSGAELIVEK
ncbi:hypothetical protein ACS0TY_004064 [Phlomoides rotata]